VVVVEEEEECHRAWHAASAPTGAVPPSLRPSVPPPTLLPVQRWPRQKEKREETSRGNDKKKLKKLTRLRRSGKRVSEGSPRCSGAGDSRCRVSGFGFRV